MVFSPKSLSHMLENKLLNAPLGYPPLFGFSRYLYLLIRRLDSSVFDHGGKMCRLLTTAGKCG